MDLSATRIHGFKTIVAILAFTAGAGSLQATNLLTATPSSVTLSCSTSAGPGSATVVVKPVTALTGVNTIAVTLGALTGGVVVTPPVTTSLSTANQTAGLTYTLSLANGCVGVTTSAPTFHFSAGGVSDVTVTVNTTLTATTSGLSVSPSPLIVTCAKNGGTYTPAAAKTVSVTSAATGGTPFTVDTATVPPPAWLTVTPTTGGTASSTAVTFTVAATAGCGAFAIGSNNQATLHLLNAPGPDKLLPVSLQILAPSPIVATPSPATLTYIKGSGTAGHVDINMTSLTTPAPFFAVDTSTLPIWLTVDSTTGTVPKSLRFTTTSVTDTLAPGTYNASVGVKVSGYSDLSVPVSLLVNNKAPKLTVEEGTTRTLSWVLGTPLPAPFITAQSTDSPIPYTLTSGGTLAPIISPSLQKGLAYSFGTQIPVTFNPLVFASAQPGSVLTGTVTLTWGTPASTIVVTFNVAVQSAGATLTTLTPATLPTAASGQTFSVVMTGTGFVPSTDLTQKTKVGIVIGGSIVADTNIAATVINPSNILLTFTVPAVADANLPFSPTGAGGTVVLGVCNPVGGTCSIPTGTATLAIGSNPIVQAVTSASAFIQVTPPALPSFAPYDMISIFGSNFCSSASTGCSSAQVLSGTPDSVSLRYPTFLSPDASGLTQRQLTVTFQTHPAGTAIATAPLLFATNNQINLMVPAAVSAQIGNPVDLVVNFGYGTGATLAHSTPFTVNIVATNPGIFTVGSDGQGDGAILNATYAVVSSTNPGGMRSTATDSDTVQLYVTGLGVPDSTGDNAAAGTLGGAVWSTDCITTASYLSTLNGLTSLALTNVDGTVIQSALLNSNRFVPCVVSTSPDLPTVTIGGVSATVVYAGFVPDSVAGLYQVNATLPGTAGGPFTSASGATVNSITAPVQLPVVITANSKTSQSGVTMWVAPRLLVTPPSGAGITGTVGVPWSTSLNVATATEGTSPYHYALTSGLLPSGLALGTSTGAITGSPAANTSGTYILTVTATDSANVPLTGTTTFTITVAGGLVVTSTGAAPYHTVFGTANASVTTVAGTGGTYPYTYVITSPVSLPAGMAVNVNTGVVSTTTVTPAGTYHVTVTATDSSATPLTGAVTFDLVVALHVTDTNPASPTNGNAAAVTTVTATGATGAVTYTLDATTLGLTWVTINASTGAVAVTTSSIAGTYPITVTATDGSIAPGATTAGTGTITFNLVVQ